MAMSPRSVPRRVVNPRSRRSRVTIPRLEGLEARQLLSTDFWNGKAGDNLWSDAGNWSAGVPGSTSDVDIPSGFATIQYTSAAGNTTIDSIVAASPIDISGGALTVQSSSAISSTISAGLTMTGGSLTASGSDTAVTVTGTTAVSGASLFAENGATLDLKQLTSYSAGPTVTTTVEASGAGSVLDLPNVTTWEGAVGCCWQAQVSALAGGEVSLPALATDKGGATRVLAQGTGSVVDLSALPKLISDQGGNYSALQATQGGQIKSPSLTNLSDVLFTIDGTGTQDTTQITSFVGDTLTVTGGSPSFTGLTTIDGSNISVSGGVNLKLAGVTEYTGGNGSSTTLEASGTGSVLDLGNVTTWEGAVGCCWQAQVSALAGGEVSLPALATDKGGATRVLAQGTGSVVDLSALPKLISDQGGNYSALQATQGGQIKSPSLTNLSDVLFTIDGTGTQDTTQITSFVGDTLTVTGGSPSFTGLTTIDGSNISVSGGVNLKLAGVTEYTGGNGSSTTLEASGTGSVLDLGNVTTWEGAVGCCWQAQVSALAGGEVSLPALATDKGGATRVLAQGTGSVVDLSALPKLISDQGGNYSALQATQGGQIKSPSLTNLSNVLLTIDGTGTQDTTQITSFVGDTLTVTGGSPSFTGLTTIDGSNISVSGGVNLKLAGVTEYTGGNGSSTTLEASGTGSVLDLGNVTTWEGAVGCCWQAQVSALAGGEVSLPALATDKGGATRVLAQGTGSVVDLSALPKLISDQGGNYSALQATQGGQIKSPSLTNLSDVLFTIDGTGTQDTTQITSFVGDTLTVTGGSPSFTGLTTIDGSNISVSGGVNLKLTGVTEYTGGNGSSTTLEASGTGSVLDLGNVTTWEGAVGCCWQAQVSALAGGEVSLPALATDKGGATRVLAQGTGSVVDLSALPKLISDQGGNYSALQATQGGQIKSPSLTNLSDVLFTIDGTGTQDTTQITSFVGDTLTVTGGSPSFTGLTTIDGSNISVSGGVNLKLAGVTEYTGGNGSSTTLEASGTGSVLDLGNVTTWEGAVGCCWQAQVSALAGGEVSLPALATDKGGATRVLAQGTGSVVDLSALPKLISDQGGNYSALQATQGGQIKSPSLTNLSNVLLTIDGTGTQDTTQITSFVGDTLTVTGGSPSFTGLTTIDGSNISVSGGVNLKLAGVTEYTGGNGSSTTLEASGTGSVLDLGNVTTWEGAVGCCWQAQVSALAGGEVSLPALATDKGGATRVLAQGTGSVVDLSALPKLISDQGGNYSALQATQGGQIKSPSLTNLSDVLFTIDGTGTQDTTQITSFVGDTLTVTGGSPSFTGLTTIDGSNISVSGGVNLKLTGVTEYTGGNGSSTTLEASGTGSVLDLGNVTTWEGAVGCCWQAQVSALAGGEVSLPALATDKGGATRVLAQGTGSVVDLSALPKLISDQGGNYSALQATQGGQIKSPSLTNLSDVLFTIDGTGTQDTTQITSFVGDTLTVTGGSPSFTGLTTIDGSNISVSGGVNLKLTGVTEYTGGNGSSTTLEASGTGSVLDLGNVTTWEGAVGCCWQAQVSALAGGEVSLPALATDKGGATRVLAQGTGSVVDLSALPKLISDQGGNYSALQATQGGQIKSPSLTNLSDVVLTVTQNGTVIDPNLSTLIDVSLVGDSTGTFSLSASLGLSITGGTSTAQVGTLLDEGSLSVQAGATLNIEGGLSVNGSGILTSAPGSTIEVSGNLLGTTQNADDFNPQGTVELDSGTGTSNPPQELEAMSDDLGAVQTGFANNFAYGTISLTSDTSVELVDLSHNTSSTSPEAVYANELIVPSGASLNLNNLHLYVRGDQVSGTIVGGTVTVVPSGGTIALNTPTPGTLTPAGASDDWTFYGTAGESITIQLNPGSGGTNPALSPLLNWGQAALLNAGGNSVASTSSTSSGAVASISGFALPASGTYTIQVEAPQSQSSSTGNYVLSVYNVTPSVSSLTVNQSYTGTIGSAYGVDQYEFTGTAGQQVELNVINSSGGVEFDLSGSGGYTAFTDLSSNSGLITLPSTGSYVVTAHGNGASGGSYAFELEQTSVTNLTLGAPYSGTLTGSGQAQLFAVNVPATEALLVSLKDSTSADVNQIYAKLGSPPTPGDYAYEFADGVAASQQLLVPSAAPGTWYILVDSVSVPESSAFTLSVTGTPITLAAVAPAQAATGSTATLTLTGSGFNNTTTVALLPMAGSAYKASSVTLDTFTQLSATFDLTGVPQGVYSVVVSNPGGQSSELAAGFTVTASGEAHFVSHLILPSEMGRHISSTIYVEYSNTGTVAMPAPLLVLYAPPEVVNGQTIVNLPLLTLNPALVVSGYWTSALPAGYSNSVQILATGTEVPGMLEPGESITVPVYYAGMQQPWSFAETSFQFALDYYTQHDTTSLDWNSLQGSLQPPGISTTAWNAISSSLATGVGGTWGGYVTMLDNEVSYLGQLGEDVTDVSELWSFAMMQADGLTPTPELAGATDIDVAAPGQASLDFSRVYQEPISSRDAIGPLGYGWSDDWQYSVSVASDGTVTVTMPTGDQRIFQPDSRGSDYFDQPGDHGILTEGTGGTFTLQETDGEVEAFNANGTLNYVQDTDGNRITAGYTSGQLTGVLPTKMLAA